MNETGDDRAPGIPTWVKALGAVLLVLLAGFLVLHLTGMAPSH